MEGELHPVDIGLLYFKLLLATKQYQEYCHAKQSNDEGTISSIQSQYPEIENIWRLWGNIFGLKFQFSEVKYFEQWLKKNYQKLFPLKYQNIKAVKAGSRVVVKPGTIYCAIPRKMELASAQHLLDSSYKGILQHANKLAGEHLVNLNSGPSETVKDVTRYECAISILFWRDHLNLEWKDVISIAIKRKSRAWNELRARIDTVQRKNGKKSYKDLNRGELEAIIKHLRRIRADGKQLSNDLLCGSFSFPKSVSAV